MAFLRLYDGAGEVDPRQQTLSEFFSSHVAERMLDDNRDPATLACYRESLKLWEQATGSPPLGAIDDAVARRFTRWLKQRRNRAGDPISSNTRRKHATHVQAVLDRLLAKSRRNKHGAGLLPDVPCLDKPAVTYREIDQAIATRDDLEKLRRALTGRWRGRGVQRRRQAWRDLYELAFYSGLRIEALLLAESRWLVDDDLAREFGGRWLAIPAAAAKTDRPYRVFLPSAAGPLMARLDGRLGPWFAGLPRDFSNLSRQRRELERAAGIAPCSRGFHSLRRLAGAELAPLNSMGAMLQLGHRGNVTLDHYTGRRVQADTVSRRAPLGW